MTNNAGDVSTGRAFTSYLKTAVRALWIGHHVYAALCINGIDFENSEHPKVRTYYKYRLAFATLWCFTSQLVFLNLALAVDVAKWIIPKYAIVEKLKNLQDVIFCAIVVPSSVFVTIVFWCFYWIDQELVYPAIVEKMIPSWLNHCLHTNISVMIAVEALMQPRRKAVNGILESCLSLLYFATYCIVMYYVRITAGVWLYGVFAIMNWWQLCIYQVGIILFFYFSYRIQFPINRFVHGSDDYDGVLRKIKKLFETNMTQDHDLNCNKNVDKYGAVIINKTIN